MSEQPAWLSNDSAAPPSAAPAPAYGGGTGRSGGGGGGFMSSINNTSLPAILRIMRFINFLCASGMVILGVFTFIAFADFATVITAGYAVFMGLVIVMFECQCGFLDESLRDNFGFLFSFAGRLTFMVFCALLNFGFGIGGYIVGIAMILAGLFNAYVICAHPEFTAKLGARSDPTNGSKTAEQLAQERAAQYARDNPEQVASWAAQGANAAASSGPK